MKHLIHSTNGLWKFYDKNTPLPAYSEIGLAEHQEPAVLVVGVKPTKRYMAVEQYHFSALYDGPSKQDAEWALRRHDEGAEYSTGHIREYGPILPEGEFQLVQLKETRQILVVPGEDTSDRCFLLGEFSRGDHCQIGTDEAHTTGRVLNTIGRKSGGVLFLALLKKDEKITWILSKDNKVEDQVVEFLYNGEYVEKKSLSLFTWGLENEGIATVSGLSGINAGQKL